MKGYVFKPRPRVFVSLWLILPGQARLRLDQVDANLFGVTVNMAPRRGKGAYGYAYGYGYEYSYEPKQAKRAKAK